MGKRKYVAAAGVGILADKPGILELSGDGESYRVVAQFEAGRLGLATTAADLLSGVVEELEATKDAEFE